MNLTTNYPSGSELDSLNRQNWGGEEGRLKWNQRTKKKSTSITFGKSIVRGLTQTEMRDDFSLKTKDLLAKRVANRCSNPGCRQLTCGPQEDPAKVVNIGVAAHITAASTDGPRFDASLTADQRRSGKNGIWLCQSCAKLVDNDPIRYGVDVLCQWKVKAEKDAALELVDRRSIDIDSEKLFVGLERIMRDLLVEMRKDITENPLSREFVVLKKGWGYWASGHELIYYFEDHPQLENKLSILLNHGLIRDVTNTNVSRYAISEKFAEHLGAYGVSS